MIHQQINYLQVRLTKQEGDNNKLFLKLFSLKIITQPNANNLSKNRYKSSEISQPTSMNNNQLLPSQQQMVKKHYTYIFLFQMLGTFLFTYAIGCSHQQVIGGSQNFIHCFSILLPLALAGQVSGGYFNSTITIAAMTNKKHRIPQVYLPAQLLGGLLGTVWCWMITGKMVAGYKHQPDVPLQLVKFIINEFVGSFFFSICVLTLTNKFTTQAYKSWQIYISIAASLYLIRKMTGDTSINPSGAIFYQIGTAIIKQDLTYIAWIWILIIPSTVGGLVGGYFMYNVYEPLLLHTKFKNYDFQNDQYREQNDD